MDNLETLKQELIAQKNSLNSKGYTVTIANTNPSPKEITNTITTIPDLRLADATVTDVASGKTFYSGNGELKTGVAEISDSGNSVSMDEINRLIQGQIMGSYTTGVPAGATKIRAYCFTEGERSDLVKGAFVIPEGVTEIGKYAFAFTNIESITFPESLTSILAYAFTNCIYITSLDLPDGVTDLQPYTFQNITELTSISLGSALTRIQSYNFRVNNVLQSITFPASLTQIQANNFVTNPELREIRLLGNSTLFQNSGNLATLHDDCVIWCNYDAIEYYAGVTNWTKHLSKLICTYTVEEDGSFPTPTDSDNTFHWFITEADARARTNEISAPSGAGTYYLRLQAS